MNNMLLVYCAAFVTSWILLEIFFKISLSFANTVEIKNNNNFINYLRLISIALFVSTFAFFLIEGEKFINFIYFICTI
tara:strand:+ start:1342 stop:1575 length:234 start_codon:yes stop_codon:yes gene_type:complete